MSTVNLERLGPDDDEAAIRLWFEAVRLGFHEGRSSDSLFERFVGFAKKDRATMWQVPDADNPSGMPVATFVSFDYSINAGREVIPAHLISDVTVRPTHRRQGLLRALMTADLTAAHAAQVPVALLTATEATIYGRFGFGVTTSASRIEVDTAERFGINPAAIADHGSLRIIEPTDAVDHLNAIFDQFHQQQRGSVERPAHYHEWQSGSWDWESDGPNKKLRCVVHFDPAGVADAFALYVLKNEDRPRKINIEQMVWTNPKAYLAVWDFLGSVDLVGMVATGDTPIDDPLRWALADGRGYRIVGGGDRIWSRILDPIRCLQARPWESSGTSVVRIEDSMGFADATLRISVTESGEATIVETTDPADVSLDVATLGSLWLGGTRATQLAAAGLISGNAEAIATFDALTRLADPPYSVTHF